MARNMVCRFVQFLDIIFQVVKVLFKVVHQLEDVMCVAMIVTVVRTVGSGENSFQVVEEAIRLF